VKIRGQRILSESMSIEPDSETDLVAWRKRKRRELLGRRAAMTPDEHRARSVSVLTELTRFKNSFKGVIAFYFPYRGEIDVLPFMERLAQDGLVTALPVVVAPRMALQFRVWSPGCALAPTRYGIPEPAQGELVEPDVFIVPLVGFDGQLYRLGYGGGFYDRTFAAATKQVKRIGVGFACARIDTIYPQSFDVPMDMVVTENGPSK
jgi:5-formyltetrahydrofolate cyclo-ligase